MATLEDAAEQLVVKLKGLDSEIEESQHALDGGRRRVEEVEGEVNEEWAALTAAASSLLESVRGEQEQLAAAVQESVQAVGEARTAVLQGGAAARSEVNEGAAQLDAQSRHALELEPGVESLTAEAGEAPARELSERAREVEGQLTQALEEASTFLRQDVVAALSTLADGVRERCRSMRGSVVDATTARLEEFFEEWEHSVDEFEDYVSAQGFLASRSHAHAVVDWALGKCREGCQTQLEALDALVEAASRPLLELSEEVQAAGEALAGEAGAQLEALESARASAAGAAAALSAVEALLASFSFARV